MKRLASVLPVGLLLGMCAMLSACSENPVGRVCYIGTDAAVEDETIVASPALECQSRTCLHWGGGTTDLCTAECSDDSDCDKSPESPCVKGFSCTVPVTVGPFCCRKMCVCRDYLPAGLDGGIPEQAACDPNQAINECCNLANRRGNPLYPACVE